MFILNIVSLKSTLRVPFPYKFLEGIAEAVDTGEPLDDTLNVMYFIINFF